MANIDSTGLHLDSLSTIVSNLETAMMDIYGSDINIQSDSPDGQMLNIFAQAVIDLQELLQQVNSMFDPDQAFGSILDQRVAINGIQRMGATYTVTNITIVTSQALNLFGLDQSLQPVYTIQDSAGTQWQLQTSIVLLGAGTNVMTFQAAVPGAVYSSPNSITLPVTVVLGVTSVNNPTTYNSLGADEESDSALKIRRQQSVSLSSQGYLASLLAALLNTSGIISAFVYENTTGSTDGNGVPGHSIWVIIQNSNVTPASSAEIANAIYTKRNAGCGLKGAASYNIAQVDGTTFTVLWDYVTPENIFIKFTATSINGVALCDYASIIPGLVASFSPAVAQTVNIGSLSTVVQSFDPNTLVTVAGFSTSSTGSYTNTLTPIGKNYQFAVSADKIIILPILLTPTAPSVVHNTTKQFGSIGGYGTYVYSIPTNNSGGSITSVGLYTAGTTSSVVDVVKVVDALSNSTTVSVSVT